ncbi:MAG: hypothetical protein QXY55_05450 [Candidatus Korarchaeota archaeon]
MTRGVSMYLLVALLVATLLPPVTVAATVKTFPYSIVVRTAGVIELDRINYTMANGNPLGEDIANAVFQGPGRLGSPTVGFMKDIHISLTNYGNLIKMNYTGEETGQFHWLPVIEDTPVGRATGVTQAPLEGWALAYNMTVYPTDVFSPDAGYLVVTYSGYAPGGLRPSVIGYDDDDHWVIDSNYDVWVDNPRLLVIYYNVTATNEASPYRPTFSIEQVIIFNKATKMVQIFQRATLVHTELPRECMSVKFNLALARMAIIDANPYCDRAFYGWKEATIGESNFFIVLSWTNDTLRKWVRADLGYDYYGAYMLGYPAPNSYALVSTWNVRDAMSVWHVTQLRYSPYNNYVYLNMGDIDGDGDGDGDQALIRFEWYSDTPLLMPEELEGHSVGWVMVMYGVYDVASRYDGGEGGIFEAGELTLSNGEVFTAPQSQWTHSGSLGWLNGLVTDEDIKGREGKLNKSITRLDINQNGVIGANERNIRREWYPTEELWWQLSFKFDPPRICDLLRCEYAPSFIAVPAPGATPDAAGAAYLNSMFAAMLVTFDVEAHGLVATVGYTNPATKMLPYLMLRLEPIPSDVEDYPARRAHYLTSDGRALLQMEWQDRETTEWRDVHYLVISIAGYHPNLVTYYFTDFTPIFRIIGGPYSSDFAVLPTHGIVQQAPYAGTRQGLGVIAIGKDHFGNVGLLVYGLDAQDTYWTAWYFYNNFENLCENLARAQAVLLRIDYTNVQTWGDGRGIPTAHPSYPNIVPIFASTEYQIIPPPCPRP